MTQIKVNGELKEDQRRNGARMKLCPGDWVKITIAVITLIFACGGLTWAVANNSRELDKCKVRIETNCNRSRDNLKDILSIKEDIKEIKQDIKVLLMYQKRNHDEYN